MPIGAEQAGTRVELDVRLVPNVARLHAVVVEGLTVDGVLNDARFYRREQRERGRFLGPDFFATFGGAGLSSVMRDTPRVIVERIRGNYYAFSRMGGSRCRMNVFIDGNPARHAGRSPALGGLRDEGTGLDHLVIPEAIHAVEVYPTIVSVPREFQLIGPDNNQLSTGRANRIPSPGRPPTEASRNEDDGPQDAACGAIVIWTKGFGEG